MELLRGGNATIKDWKALKGSNGKTDRDNYVKDFATCLKKANKSLNINTRLYSLCENSVKFV